MISAVNKYSVLANVRSQQFIREDGDAKPHIYVTAIVEVLRDYRGYPISRRAHPLSSHCLLVPALMHISPDHIPATLPVSADVLADLSGQFSASGDPAPMGCAFDTVRVPQRKFRLVLRKRNWIFSKLRVFATFWLLFLLLWLVVLGESLEFAIFRGMS